MVTFIDDDLPVAIEQFRQILPTRQGLHEGDVDFSGRFHVIATDKHQFTFGELKKTL